MDVRDAPDALGPRLCVLVHAAGPDELSGRPRSSVRALWLRAAADRLRQSQGGGDEAAGGLGARAVVAVRSACVALLVRSVFLPTAHGPRQRRRRVSRQGDSLA